MTGTEFKANEHYFQVRVNEMYLTSQREWGDTFDPVIFVFTGFNYGTGSETVPFVVGPTMMQDFERKAPVGMIFSDTRVAGLHPYRGGRLNLTVVLGRIRRESYSRQFLQFIENAAKLLDFASLLSTYLKLAGAIMEGVEALMKSDGIHPLVGLRKEFDPAGGDVLAPGYYALIDEPDVKPESLWVREHQLFKGKSLVEAEPFRAANYVLYSLVQADTRNDLTTLPFYPLWERVAREAMGRTDEAWESAQHNWSSLAQDILFSPDLTENQANDLVDQYEEKLNIYHEKRRTKRGEKAEAPDLKLDAIRARSLSIFKNP